MSCNCQPGKLHVTQRSHSLHRNTERFGERGIRPQRSILFKRYAHGKARSAGHAVCVHLRFPRCSGLFNPINLRKPRRLVRRYVAQRFIAGNVEVGDAAGAEDTDLESFHSDVLLTDDSFSDFQGRW